MTEVVSRVWLYAFSDRDQFTRYARFTEIPRDHWWYINSDPYLPYRPNPEYKSGLLFHNSRGFRSDELMIPKPDNVFRIAVLGGSTVYTIKVNNNAMTFPNQLEKILNSKQGKKKIEVLNAGVGGYTSWECLINFEFNVMDYEPDLLVLYLGVNDVHARIIESRLYLGNNSGYRARWRLPEESFWDLSVFARIIRRNSGISPQIGLRHIATVPRSARLGLLVNSVKPDERNKVHLNLLKTNPPIYFERNIRSIVAIAQANNISVMLSTWAYSPHMKCYATIPYYQWGFSQHNQILQNIAADSDLPIFDFSSVMLTESGYWADGRHVNEKGARLKAELFAEFIQKNNLVPTEQD
ncbi:hypothetical protein K8T06_18095 [bacterium]|nr:hypothetical protein [bacterium]